jgi:dihydroorotate dehydrogenase
MLYDICGGDAERVHDLTLSRLHNQNGFERLVTRVVGSLFFTPSENLMIEIKGIRIALPFGTAAGMDKDCEALLPFSHIFGFQEPGTIVVPIRKGNDKPRIAPIESLWDIVNAQGFPSKGKNYAEHNLRNYRTNGGKGIIFANICGLPILESHAIAIANYEMENLITELNSHVNGFVWNPFSPNTDALKLLRQPSVFYDTAQLMRQSAGDDRPILVKIGPYESNEGKYTLGLVRSFLNGGGDGVVTTNTKMVQKEELPEGIRETWGYKSAGRSGAFLRDYRMRSVRDIRMEFPDCVIVATGGIDSTEDAYETILYGANLEEFYTPLIYRGTGLVRELSRGLSDLLRRRGTTLADLQTEVTRNAWDGTLDHFAESMMSMAAIRSQMQTRI